MDFVTHLPVSTRGYDAIFSIVDRFSRFCRFIPCHTAMSALDCADLLKFVEMELENAQQAIRDYLSSSSRMT